MNHEALASGEEGRGAGFLFLPCKPPSGPRMWNADNRLLVEAPYSTSLEGFLESE